jgi:hypothetical protein
MSKTIRVIFFQEGETWLAQGLEHDICVQAATLDELYGRFEVAVCLESEPTGNLDHIEKAPDHFFKLWDRRSGSYSPIGVTDSHFEMALAA